MSKLDVNIVERKWGQGAKAIGDGTGMSPVPMMNEMSMPTVYLEAQILK
mgnify:CR=1 FL=1